MCACENPQAPAACGAQLVVKSAQKLLFLLSWCNCCHKTGSTTMAVLHLVVSIITRLVKGPDCGKAVWSEDRDWSARSWSASLGQVVQIYWLGPDWTRPLTGLITLPPYKQKRITTSCSVPLRASISQPRVNEF